MFLKVKHTHLSVPPRLRETCNTIATGCMVQNNCQLSLVQLESDFSPSYFNSDLCFILPCRDLPEILVTHDQKYEMGRTDQRGECLLIGLFQFATLKHDRTLRACLITPRLRHTMYCPAWAPTHCSIIIS